MDWKKQANRAMDQLLSLGQYLPGARTLSVTHQTVSSELLDRPVRLIQLSDLHGRKFGPHQAELLRVVRKQLKTGVTNLIVLTGDLMQRYYEGRERENVVDLLHPLAMMAPTFAILGNHEARSKDLVRILDDFKSSAVTLLDDEAVDVGGLRLFGLRTGTHGGYTKNHADQGHAAQALRKLSDDPLRPFTVLLAHKPEDFELYARYPVDLVLAGHAHGGFLSLGKIGAQPIALVAPGQGLFPTYTRGMYTRGRCHMYVHTGLGGPRIGVPAEVAVLDLTPRRYPTV